MMKACSLDNPITERARKSEPHKKTSFVVTEADKRWDMY